MFFFEKWFSLVSVFYGKKRGKASVFLNLISTEVRPEGAKQKIASLFPIIDLCLTNGRKVNFVVFTSLADASKALSVYKKLLREYDECSGFNLVVVVPSGRWRTFFYSMASSFVFFFKIKGFGISSLNFSSLLAISHIRIKRFQAMYDILPCQNWLGLTGGVELPALKGRADQRSDNCYISALQFGQASYEQEHFSGYKVDVFFSYDSYSQKIYKELGVNSSRFIVSGSPEFEYHKRSICNYKLKSQNKLSIIFVDQPVMERGEYDRRMLRSFLEYIQCLILDPEINFSVKAHPRSSSFETDLSYNVVDDWADCLSRAHVVIGYFSNLCDFSLISGRPTLYFGCGGILAEEKKAWIHGLGGCVTDDLDVIRYKVEGFKKSFRSLADEIVSSSSESFEKPSSVIYGEMVVRSDAEAVD